LVLVVRATKICADSSKILIKQEVQAFNKQVESLKVLLQNTVIRFINISKSVQLEFAAFTSLAEEQISCVTENIGESLTLRNGAWKPV
jgi:hypothetical protein